MIHRRREKAVATPMRQYVRILRQRYLPIIVWSGMLCVLISISWRQWNRLDARGIVSQRQVAVSPLFDGTLKSIDIGLFDNVEAGQIVAVMDDTLVRGELTAAEAELGHLRALLEAEKTRLTLETDESALDELNTQRRFALDEETVRLDYLDRMIQQESDKITLELLQVEMQKQKQLLESKVTDALTYDTARLRYEAMAKQVQENEQALAEARVQRSSAQQRKAEAGPSGVQVQTDMLLKPFQEALLVQESIIQGIQERRGLLALRAPTIGKVNQILHCPGDTVLAGAAILTIARSDSTQVVAYVDLRMIDRLTPGEQVEVYSRRKNVPAISSRILKVGPQVDPYPPQMLAAPQFPQWGMPILVGELPNGLYYPGEIVDIRIYR